MPQCEHPAQTDGQRESPSGRRSNWRRVNEAIPSNPDVEGRFGREIGYQVTTLVIGHDDLAEPGRRVGCFGDHPHARFRSASCSSRRPRYRPRRSRSGWPTPRCGCCAASHIVDAIGHEWRSMDECRTAISLALGIVCPAEDGIPGTGRILTRRPRGCRRLLVGVDSAGSPEESGEKLGKPAIELAETRRRRIRAAVSGSGRSRSTFTLASSGVTRHSSRFRHGRSRHWRTSSRTAIERSIETRSSPRPGTTWPSPTTA